MKFLLLFVCLASFLVQYFSIVTGIPVQKEKKEVRIIAGHVAKQGQFPFMASIHHDTHGFICSGVLVKTNWILTSAYCVWDYHQERPVNLRALIGGVHLEQSEAGRFSYPLDEIMVHRDYSSSNGGTTKGDYLLYNNMALLRVQSPVVPGDNIRPIVLPNIGEEALPSNGVLMTAGWGGSSSRPSEVLLYTPSHIHMDTAECAIQVGLPLTNLDICTYESYQATCKYDDGGPLFYSDPLVGYILTGIVNYAPCGVPLPNVFASVSGQRLWIATIIGS